MNKSFAFQHSSCEYKVYILKLFLFEARMLHFGMVHLLRSRSTEIA